jgi:hypothetical protein
VKITWKHVAKIHLKVQKGSYRSEQEIWQREADLLNKIASKKKKRADRRVIMDAEMRDFSYNKESSGR